MIFVNLHSRKTPRGALRPFTDAYGLLRQAPAHGAAPGIPPTPYPSQPSDIQPLTKSLGGNNPQAKWQVAGNQLFTEPVFVPSLLPQGGHERLVLTLCLRGRVATQTFRLLCCRHPGKEEICLGEKVIPLQGGPGPIPGSVPGTPSMALKAFRSDACGPGPGLQSGPGPRTDYRVELNKLPDWNGNE